MTPASLRRVWTMTTVSPLVKRPAFLPEGGSAGVVWGRGMERGRGVVRGRGMVRVGAW